LSQNGHDGGRACEEDAEDFDNLEEMVQALGPEILLKKKGLQNIEGEKSIDGDCVWC
jgi:hypothetical protein